MSARQTRGIHARNMLVLGIGVLLSGCPDSGQDGPAPTQSSAPESSQEDPRRTRATEAAKALGAQLKARLTGAIQEGGLSEGIKACSLTAPDIAAAVAKEKGVKLGRTSFKLRNPANAPPEWAKAHVDARTEAPTFFEGPGGTLRALLPIRTGGLCVSCHGPSESLTEPLKQLLQERYPDDQATGFKSGDLRGWFWVEASPPQ